MGEKIRDLALFDVSGKTVVVELNHPVFETESSIVHIQINPLRFECSYGDFFKFASAVLVAEKNLKRLKDLK